MSQHKNKCGTVKDRRLRCLKFLQNGILEYTSIKYIAKIWWRQKYENEENRTNPSKLWRILLKWSNIISWNHKYNFCNYIGNELDEQFRYS